MATIVVGGSSGCARCSINGGISSKGNSDSCNCSNNSSSCDLYSWSISIQPSIYSPIYPSIHVSMYPSVLPSIHPSIYPCIHASIYPSINASTFSSSIHRPLPSTRSPIQYAHPSVYSSLYPQPHRLAYCSIAPSTSVPMHQSTNQPLYHASCISQQAATLPPPAVRYNRLLATLSTLGLTEAAGLPTPPTEPP